MQAEARRQERKQQLLQIALELFATVGYEKTKVSDIVAKGNVSQGTFYWYFKSKEAIALEMLEIGRAQLLDAIKLGYRTKKWTCKIPLLPRHKCLNVFFISLKTISIS